MCVVVVSLNDGMDVITIVSSISLYLFVDVVKDETEDLNTTVNFQCKNCNLDLHSSRKLQEHMTKKCLKGKH